MHFSFVVMHILIPTSSLTVYRWTVMAGVPAGLLLYYSCRLLHEGAQIRLKEPTRVVSKIVTATDICLRLI